MRESGRLLARLTGAALTLALASGCTNSHPPFVGATDGPQAAPVSAALTDAIGGIVAAASTHQVVAIGEIHRSAAIHSFLRSLLMDPRLPGLIDDIAVEFGASQNQGIIDRHVAGEDVPSTELERVWGETSQTSGVWDSPLYEQFFDTVRQVNLGLPLGSRFRVLLMDTVAEPPQCSTPASCEEELVDRDEHFAQVVEEQSLARGRHSLLVAGVGHVLRGNGRTPLSVIDRLESFSPGSTFVVIPNEGPVLADDVIQRAVAGWPVPTLSRLAGSIIGSRPSSILHGDLVVTCDHPPCETPDFPGAIQDVADAYLYLGP